MHFRDTPEDRFQSRADEAVVIPPRCPYAACHDRGRGIFRWERWGWFNRKRAPYLVQRFRCLACGRSFSSQTFRGSYWQKRPDLDGRVRNSGLSCSANRQIGRALGCNKDTVAQKIARAGRQAIRHHAAMLARKPELLTGRLIFDGLWSFETNPNFPYELNIAVTDLDFVLGFTESEMRRSGRLTNKQKNDRKEAEAAFGVPPRHSTRNAIADLLRASVPHFDPAQTQLWSDEHKEYPRAIRDAGAAAIPHKTVSSRAIRDAKNPLFPINLADMWFRHSQSNQKRDTIAFSKRRQGGIDRAWLFLSHRNYVRPRRIKSGDPPPAVQAGIARRAMTDAEIYSNRIFHDDVVLPAAWEKQIRREVVTRPIANNRRHSLRFAF